MLNKAKSKQNLWFYGGEMKISALETSAASYDSRRIKRVSPVVEESTPKHEIPPMGKVTKTIFMQNHFRCLRPLMIVMALYGFFPIAFKPVRLSCHPLRSTVVWVVAVNLVVGWSVYNVVWTHAAVIWIRDDAAQHANVDVKLFALQGIVHISSHFLLVIMWVELAYLRKRLKCWDVFFENHGALVSGLRVRRRLIVLTWLVVLNCVIVLPCIAMLIALKARTLGNASKQALGHVYQIVLISTAVALISTFCYTVRDMAQMLSQKLEREMLAGSMTVARVRGFRMAWLSLRELLKSVGAMPACGMFSCGYLLSVITFTAYHSFMAIQRSAHTSAVTSSALLLHSILLLLWVCDSAHQAKESVNGVMEPLKTGEWLEMSEELRKGFKQLQSVVQVFPASVSFAGYFDVNRSAFLAMMASVITYVIVLIQFRNDDGSALMTKNSTEAINYYLDLD